jgi:hypothetical protein
VCRDIITPSRVAKIEEKPLSTNEFVNQLRLYKTCEVEEKKLWEIFIPKLPVLAPEYIEEDPNAKKKKRYK